MTHQTLSAVAFFVAGFATCKYLQWRRDAWVRALSEKQDDEWFERVVNHPDLAAYFYSLTAEEWEAFCNPDEDAIDESDCEFFVRNSPTEQDRFRA